MNLLKNRRNKRSMDITRRMIPPQDVDLPDRQASRAGNTDGFPCVCNLMVNVIVPMSYRVADKAVIPKYHSHGVA
jgi:hypothetical protein